MADEKPQTFADMPLNYWRRFIKDGELDEAALYAEGLNEKQLPILNKLLVDAGQFKVASAEAERISSPEQIAEVQEKIAKLKEEEKNGLPPKFTTAPLADTSED